MRIGPVGAERPIAATADGTYWDAGPVTDDFGHAFFASDGMSRIRDSLDRGDLLAVDIEGKRVGAPIARPGVVLCIGMNYAAHAAESGSLPPDEPVLFYKAPNTVIGPDDDVALPPGAAKGDWEVELAVVIGTRARYLESPDDSLAHVAGYTISNDVSERALQLETSGGQWSKGKSCETFNPLGPWLSTLDELEHPHDLRLRSSVNGAPRQDSSTADMIFDVAHLVWALSQVTVLEPGDLINTGTPEGVALSGRFPYLNDGDVMRMAIEGLGTQTQRIVRGRR